jgi:Flp pilus assembly protein TadG
MPGRNVQVKRLQKEEAGTVLIAFALFLFILLGFCALGMEAGRWYMVRAELSKSVDAGALAAARNISNPYVTLGTLAEEFAAANFPSGYLGTPGSGAGRVTFTVTVDPLQGRVEVVGNVSATSILARPFLLNGLIPTSSRGIAQKKEVEIMLVLDRSGSMGMGRPVPMDQLKAAASSFVEYFRTTQETDKMGLISFSTAVTLDRPLGTNYVTDMQTAIGRMSATSYTNAEDALDQADGPGGFTDQTGVPTDRRVQQFLIFFSDGQPTAFRGRFGYRGTNYDAVAVGATVTSTGDCDPNTFATSGTLYNPGTGAALSATRVYPTGDGTTTQIKCSGGPLQYTARWYIFDTMPVPGYPATASCIPSRAVGAQFCTIANQLALDHAAELKARNIVIYTIGLGNIDAPFMQAIANPNLYYRAPTPSQLRAIFQQVAQEIKLRLVQ